MRPHRINPKAPVRPSKAMETQSGSQVPVVIPANGWVMERTDENNVRTVLPLPAWEIVDHQIYPLPRSIGDNTIVRPMVDSDQAAIQATALRMRPQTTNQHPTFWSEWKRHIQS